MPRLKTPTKPPTPRVALPDDDLGLVRLPMVLALLPISRSAWWKGIADGKYPQPVRLSRKVSAWRAREIRQLLTELGAGT